MRLIVTLEPKTKGWFIYPGGQSGNPGSPHYTSFVELWRQGQYIPVTIDANEMLAKEAHTLMLHPAQ